MTNLNPKSRTIGYRRVEPTAEITSPKYSHFLCFSVKVRTNKFIQAPLERYTSQQEKIFNLIKSLKESGIGYRKISYYLNDKEIFTIRGNRWGASNVYSVLKRHKERRERMEYMDIEYEPVWGSMEVNWEKN